MSAHDEPDLAELDWASLGDEAFAGEQDDEALLQGVLADIHDEPAAAAATQTPARGARTPPWGLFAAAAVAAAVLLFWLTPKAWLGFESATDVDTLAPDVVDSTPAEQTAEPRVHARRPSPNGSQAPQHAVLHDAPNPSTPPTAAAPPRSPQPSPRQKKRAPPQPSPTADDLLRIAQDTLARGDRGAALAAYRALAEAHPRSAEARAAWVSIGRLHLRAGRAKAALAAFDHYLASPRGTLRQEARYGRLQALRKQGALDEERQEIEAFMRDFPRSLYAGRLRARLEELP